MKFERICQLSYPVVELREISGIHASSSLEKHYHQIPEDYNVFLGIKNTIMVCVHLCNVRTSVKR